MSKKGNESKKQQQQQRKREATPTTSTTESDLSSGTGNGQLPQQNQKQSKCDDNAALERLSQLLTGSSDNDTGTGNTLNGFSSDDQQQQDKPVTATLRSSAAVAPIAKPEESIEGSTLASEPGEEQIFQELDDAFTSLDNELAEGSEKNQPQPEVSTKTTTMAATGNENKPKTAAAANGRIVSAPTAI